MNTHSLKLISLTDMLGTRKGITRYGTMAKLKFMHCRLLVCMWFETSEDRLATDKDKKEEMASAISVMLIDRMQKEKEGIRSIEVHLEVFISKEGRHFGVKGSSIQTIPDRDIIDSLNPFSIN